jgi:hypothetical protein
MIKYAKKKPQGTHWTWYLKVTAVLVTVGVFLFMTIFATMQLSEEQQGASKLFLRNKIRVVRSIPRAVMNFEVTDDGVFFGE